MKITKLEHSGLAIEKDGETLICDPVEFTQKLPTFHNVAAIVITHKHSDHLQPEVLARILQDNPEAKVFTAVDAAPSINGTIVVRNGDTYNVGEFKLDFFGKDHAAIVPGQIPCENIGVIVDDRIINPGDSFDLPNIKPEVLLVPISAPWCKVSESVDFVEKTHPSIVIPVHDAVLSDLGKKFNGNWLNKTCESMGAKFTYLKPGDSVEL